VKRRALVDAGATPNVCLPSGRMATSSPTSPPLTRMKTILLLLVASTMLSQCSGFKPVQLEHDDKEQLDYREGDWMPANS